MGVMNVMSEMNVKLMRMKNKKATSKHVLLFKHIEKSMNKFLESETKRHTILVKKY